VHVVFSNCVQHSLECNGCGLSGGGSALLPAPVPPVTLRELTDVTRLLARAGATIYQLNTLRKHLELMKGGGLAKVAYPAKVKMAIIILSFCLELHMQHVTSFKTFLCLLPVYCTEMYMIIMCNLRCLVIIHTIHIS